MKKILAFFLVIILCLTLAACIGTPAEATNTNDYNMDKVAYFDDLGLTIYREPVTDVLYMVYNGVKAGGMTVMLDPETGLPMTFTNYLAQYNEMFQN